MKKLLSNEKARFLIAGCANTALDFILLNVLVFAFSVPALAGNAISVTIGICVSYVLNHVFVFRYQEPLSLKRFGMFFLVTGFSSLVLQNAIIYLFEWLFGTEFGRSLLFLPAEDGNQILALNIAKAVAVVVGLIWNFTFYKLVIFRSSRRTAESVADGEKSTEDGTDAGAVLTHPTSEPVPTGPITAD